MKIAMRIVFALIGLAVLAAILWRWQVNGWGSIAWLAGIILVNVIRVPFARQVRDNTIAESRQTLVERILLAGMAFGGAAAAPASRHGRSEFCRP